METKKKLYKSKIDKKICGVCGGIAEYLNIDTTIVRLALCLCVLLFGFGIIAYFVAALVMDYPPEESGNE